MKRLLLAMLLLAMFSFIAGNALSTYAEETPEEKPEFSEEFLKKVEKRLKYFQKALKRYATTKGKSGDALAQAARDQLTPADHPDIVNAILQTLNSIKDGQVQSAAVKVPVCISLSLKA